ncbi:ABC transporter substrate-binding protein [Microbacterium sp.]|uniref:ABC transporter substrate-binding protein n=1 Tax=Microbacterium sp. TaxID=51671 RepID=UPI003C71EEA1
MISRRILAGVAAGALAITLTACAGSAGPTADTTTPTASGEFFGLLPADVQSAGSVTVGTEAYYPPYEFLDTDGSTVIGFDIDLLNAVVARLGIDYKLENVAFDTLLPSLDAGRYDVVVAAVSDTAERQTNYDFVDYFLAGQAIITLAGETDGLSTLDDLCGLTVAVLRDSAQESMLNDLNSGACASSPVDVLSQPSDTDALLQVQSGRAQASLAQEPVGRYNAKQVGGGSVFEVANSETIEPSLLGYVFKKGSADLQTAFQTALQSLIDDGSYAAILDKWDLGSGAVETATINGATAQ